MQDGIMLYKRRVSKRVFWKQAMQVLTVSSDMQGGEYLYVSIQRPDWRGNIGVA